MVSVNYDIECTENQSNGRNDIHLTAILVEEPSQIAACKQPHKIASWPGYQQPCTDLQQIDKTVGIRQDKSAESRQIKEQHLGIGHLDQHAAQKGAVTLLFLPLFTASQYFVGKIYDVCGTHIFQIPHVLTENHADEMSEHSHYGNAYREPCQESKPHHQRLFSTMPKRHGQGIDVGRTRRIAYYQYLKQERWQQ